jgi:hypothetical protein
LFLRQNAAYLQYDPKALLGQLITKKGNLLHVRRQIGFLQEKSFRHLIVSSAQLAEKILEGCAVSSHDFLDLGLLISRQIRSPKQQRKRDSTSIARDSCP